MGFLSLAKCPLGSYKEEKLGRNRVLCITEMEALTDAVAQGTAPIWK